MTERSTPTKAAYLAGIDEEELPTSEEGETDNLVYDAMANLLGKEKVEARGGQEAHTDSERTLMEAEALDCLATIVQPPPKPRTWGEARRIVADKKTNRGFRNLGDGNKRVEQNIEESKERTKCGICKKVGHWHRECPENPKNQNNPQEVSWP